MARVFLLVVILVYGLVPVSVQAKMTDNEAVQIVQQMLANSDSADEIIQFLVDDGWELDVATALTVKLATNGRERMDLAKAGICAAEDNTQADKVGEAAILEVVDSETMVRDIHGLVQGYQTGMCDEPDWREYPLGGSRGGAENITTTPPGTGKPPGIITGPGTDVSPSN
jgi:hypothetical protein